ncbi:GPCR kinase [Tanacetum coccineum]
MVGVGEFSPPYYISQLGDSLIIFGSFGFGAFRIIYAWALDFEDGIISSCNLLFTIPHPAGHFLKLIGFSNAKEPIVEAEIVQQCDEVNDFKSAAWVSATNYVNTFDGTVTECLGDVDNFLKNGKLEQVVGIVKSCSPNMIGDLNVTLKDLSGTIPGTIHYKVISNGGYGNDITIGAAMILTNVSVFSPNPSNHYLNITKRNVVEVFRKYTVLGNGSG